MKRKLLRASARAKTFRMPAEWEPHEATWLGWPHERTDWPGKFAPIPWAFAEIVRHLARVERVLLIVEDAAAESEAKKILRKSGADLQAITFLRIPTDRGWMRDSGPIAVLTGGRNQTGGELVPEPVIPRNAATKNPSSSGEREERFIAPPTVSRNNAAIESGDDLPYCTGARLLLNFVFNGWAKYDDYKKDARVVERANRLLKQRVELPEHKGRRAVLEGGSIDVNGRGSLLTTEECLLSTVQERNPGFAREDYEEMFRRYLGVTNVLWLRNGIAGDDTHGHVDDLTRFVDPTTVVTVVEDDPAEQNYQALQENLALLRGMHDQDGRELRVGTLPMPRPVWFDGQRLPASYANFYIANKIVLVPTFNDPADRVALDTLAALFPTREIVPIYCRDLVLGLGTIHCMTQQLPRGS
ncbi:MAG: agmatine deiminase family protein [Candidatus Acidiferrales bacterium]